MRDVAIKRIIACQRAQVRGKSAWAKDFWSRIERELRIKYRKILQQND